MTPVAVEMLVENGESVIVDGTAFRAFSTPGHTPGALSWQWKSCDDNGDCQTVVYADSLSPVSHDDYRFSDHPDYLAAYREGLLHLAGLECDILLTPHPGASFMTKRAEAGTFTGRHYLRGVCQSGRAGGSKPDLPKKRQENDLELEADRTRSQGGRASGVARA